MGLFRPYERDAEAKAPEPEAAPTQIPKPGKPGKKEGATPSRREAEAARRERLNPSLSPKQMRARERAAKNAERNEQYAKSEAAPSKVLARDFVDSRRSLAQWAMPVLALTLAFSLAVTSMGSGVAWVVTVLTYTVFLAIGVDLFLMWRKLKRLHAERLPNAPTKGLLAYMLNRAIYPRRIRTPAPRVKPGDQI